MPHNNAQPTLILVHGAWHNAAYWEVHFAPWLREQGYQVLCPDLPGHGTPGPKRIRWYSINDYADHIEQVIRQQDTSVVVVGHSMGGHITQKIMERHPGQLVGAGLIASVPPAGAFGAVGQLLPRHPLKVLRASLLMDMYQLVNSTALAKELFYTDKMDQHTLEQYSRWVQNESYRAFLDMLLLNLPKPARIDNALPKWIVGGENDVLFPPASVHKTAQAYGIEAKIYPGMAHSSLILEDGWQQVAADLHAWLKTLTK